MWGTAPLPRVLLPPQLGHAIQSSPLGTSQEQAGSQSRSRTWGLDCQVTGQKHRSCPFLPPSSSDSSSPSISGNSRQLPSVSCLGPTTALSLAKEVIKQLSFSYCLWVSLISWPQTSLAVPKFFPLALISCVWGVHQHLSPPRTTLFCEPPFHGLISPWW